jgi:hypothetical protein
VHRKRSGLRPTIVALQKRRQGTIVAVRSRIQGE